MKNNFLLAIVLISIVFVSTGCGQKEVANDKESNNLISSEERDEGKTGLANPASVYCGEQGGNLVIVEGLKGQYGICYFKDDYQCEEWAMYRGECPIGGVNIADYDDEAQIYCVIRGGSVSKENNVCTLKNGEEYNLGDYYEE